MARGPELTEEERAAVQRRIARWVQDEPNLSWRARAREIEERTKERLSNQALMDASRGQLGSDVATVLEKFFGETLGSWMKMKTISVSEPGSSAAAAHGHVYEIEERYHTVGVAFSRARASGVKEGVLNTVRLKLGVLKSKEGPSEKQVEQAILDEVNETKRASKLYSAKDIDEGLKR